MDRGLRRSGAGRTAAVVLALALSVAGCGSHSSAGRTRTAAYVRQVNRIEVTLTGPLALVTRTSTKIADVSTHAGPAAVHLADTEAASLRGAERKISAAQAQLTALAAPAPARRLRSLLIRLAADQARLTEQTARLITFLPAYSAELRPLAPATLTLERTLAVNQAAGATAVQTVYAHKAAALRAFATAVSGILGRLHRLTPPAVSMPGYRAQVASLSGMRSASDQLATALGAGRTSGLTALLTRFDRAAAANSSVTVARAQQAAERRYDAQVTALSTLSGQAQAERARLSTALS